MTVEQTSSFVTRKQIKEPEVIDKSKEDMVQLDGHISDLEMDEYMGSWFAKLMYRNAP